MFLHNTKQHEAMPTEFVAIKAIEKQKQEMHGNQNEIDLKTNCYGNKKGFKIKKLNDISLKIYNNSPPCCLLRLNCSRDANFPAFFPFLVKTRRHRSADLRELGKWSWLEWILQNQVSARRLELNKIIFRQIAPTLYDLVVLKDQVY